MPTYEYACTSCNRRFDVVQSFSDAPLEVCEVCEGRLKRVFHPVGIVLKGSGFYATDNRSGKGLASPSSKDGKDGSSSSSSSESSSESSSSSSSSSSSDAKKETKTEKKAETKSEPSKKPDAGKST